MNGILVDTSIIIDYLRQKDKGKTTQFNLEKGSYKLFISIITYAESYAGKGIWERNEAKEILKKLLSGFQVLPLDEEISEQAGAIRARYDTSITDAIIAATAISHKLKLATLNTKDFNKIKTLKLLDIT